MERLPFLMEIIQLLLLVLDQVGDISESGEKLIHVLGRVVRQNLVMNLIDHGHLRGDLLLIKVNPLFLGRIWVGNLVRSLISFRIGVSLVEI